MQVTPTVLHKNVHETALCLITYGPSVLTRSALLQPISREKKPLITLMLTFVRPISLVMTHERRSWTKLLLPKIRTSTGFSSSSRIGWMRECLSLCTSLLGKLCCCYVWCHATFLNASVSHAWSTMQGGHCTINRGSQIPGFAHSGTGICGCQSAAFGPQLVQKLF